MLGVPLDALARVAARQRVAAQRYRIVDLRLSADDTSLVKDAELLHRAAQLCGCALPRSARLFAVGGGFDASRAAHASRLFCARACLRRACAQRGARPAAAAAFVCVRGDAASPTGGGRRAAGGRGSRRLASHGPVALPTRVKRWVVLGSPFKHKATQEHFEMRTHERFVRVEGAPSDVNKFMRFAMSFASQTVGIQYRVRAIEPLASYYTLGLPAEHELRVRARQRRANELARERRLAFEAAAGTRAQPADDRRRKEVDN